LSPAADAGRRTWKWKFDDDVAFHDRADAVAHRERIVRRPGS